MDVRLFQPVVVASHSFRLGVLHSFVVVEHPSKEEDVGDGQKADARHKPKQELVIEEPVHF